MSDPRVSVVIPVFNRPTMIVDAIRSVLEQERRPDEIIVVDDGSTDDTAAVAARFPVRVISQENRGISGARNRGIDESVGDLVAFLDSDDIWTPNRLSRQLQRMSGSPPVDLVFGRYREVHVREGTTRSIPTPFEGWIASAALVRRRVFERVGCFETDLRVGEFVSWCARVREAGIPMAMIPEVLVTRRVHGGNVMGEPTGSRSDYARLLKASLDRRRESDRKNEDAGET